MVYITLYASGVGNSEPFRYGVLNITFAIVYILIATLY